MKKLVVLLFALALVPSVASAGTITEVWHSTGSLSVYLTGHSTINTLSGYATLTVTNSTNMSPLALGASYESYCVDLLHWSSNPMSAYTDNLRDWALYGAAGTAPARAAAASWLLNTYSGVGNDTAKSALQIAIWEVLYETGTLNASNGNVSFSNAALNTAANALLGTWSTFLSGNPNYAGDAVWIRTGTVPTDNNVQDFATTMQVPEPGSMLLLGSGMIGLATVIRRRPRK